VEEVIAHVIQKHYLQREHVSQEEVVARTRSVCRRRGLPAPSRGTIRRRIAQYNDYVSDMRRSGSKQAKQRWEPRPGSFFVERALDVVQIDHTLVDIMVLSDDRSEVLGRPWLTVAIDVATRVVLGFYLSMDPPSAVSVGLCIAHAVLPKPEDARDHGLWPMFGKMKLIHVDNGKDLVSAAIQRGCEEHGIVLDTRPIGKPYYGGHIERLMGTLMKMVHGLPGTTFSNVREKGDYDSERKATLTLMELHEWMLQKIGRSYHTRVHRMLGVAPLVAWERAWRTEAGQMMLPPLIARQEEFRLDFLPFQLRRLQRTGIQLWQSRYWSEPLACIAHPDCVVQVHYHPHELGHVWVRTPDGRVVEAHAVAGPAAGRPRMRAMNAAERERVETLCDTGFAKCDRIENMAASETRARNRRNPRNATKDRRSFLRQARDKDLRSDNSSPDVTLDRSSVQVKRFV
jgi:putative transposase